MKACCRKFFCFVFCCKCCQTSSLKLIDDTTLLLPKTLPSNKSLIEKPELFAFGEVPFQFRSSILLSSLTSSPNASIKKIVCGSGHCIFLTSDHKLFGFGDNEQGQLGIALDTPSHKYINTVQELKVSSLPSSAIIKDIACGDVFSLILVQTAPTQYQIIRFGIHAHDKYKTQLKQYSVVHNEELPREVGNDVVDSVYAFGKRSVVLTYKRREGDEGNYSSIRLYVGNVDFENNCLDEYVLFAEYDYSVIQIKSIGLGLSHMVILLTDLGKSKLYGVGDNTYGELGEGKTSLTELTEIAYENIAPAQIKKISCGARHNLILYEKNAIAGGLIPHEEGSNNVLYAVGDNSEGQGYGFNARNGVPIEVDVNGNVVDCYCGYSHNVIVMENGDVMSWGQAAGGKLGYMEEHLTQGVPKVVMKLKQKSVGFVGMGEQMTVVYTGRSKDENEEMLLSNSFEKKLQQ